MPRAAGKLLSVDRAPRSPCAAALLGTRMHARAATRACTHARRYRLRRRAPWHAHGSIDAPIPIGLRMQAYMRARARARGSGKDHDIMIIAYACAIRESRDIIDQLIHVSSDRESPRVRRCSVATQRSSASGWTIASPRAQLRRATSTLGTPAPPRRGRERPWRHGPTTHTPRSGSVRMRNRYPKAIASSRCRYRYRS